MLKFLYTIQVCNHGLPSFRRTHIRMDTHDYFIHVRDVGTQVPHQMLVTHDTVSMSGNGYDPKLFRTALMLLHLMA
jgi:hypothetical protein